MLSDVRVIAIDQQLVQGAEANASDTQARTVTFEVTQEQAERVSVATRLGKLSLSVRSAATGPDGAHAMLASQHHHMGGRCVPALGAKPRHPCRTP